MSTIAEKTIRLLEPAAASRRIADIRIGLGFTCALLDSGHAGLAWTGASESTGCTKMMRAGSMAGSSAADILKLLADDSQISRSAGLAAANALIASVAANKAAANGTDILDILNLQPEDYVVMAGFFGYLIPKIKKTGCRFDVVELDGSFPDVLSPEQGRAAFAECSVALITSTSVVTGTIDGLLDSLRNHRAAVMLGPSTLMLPEIFRGTPVTHLAGSWVTNSSKALQTVSEGGGTMVLKPYMDFDTIELLS